MTTVPLLEQLHSRVPAHIACLFRMEETGSGGNGGGDQGGGGAGNAPQTFSQADVDRIVQDRLGRQQAKFSDYDDLKSKAAKFDEAQEQAKTEHQKALDKATKDADSAARADERGRWSKQIVAAEVRAVAGGKLADPADAVSMLDLSEFKVDDHGQVDAKAVGAAIDKLLEAKPYLAAGAASPAGSVPPTFARALRGAANGGTGGDGKPDLNDWVRGLARR